jgi:1-acyl-sn-glycerol-3-phosphate acyltransferase
LARTTANLSAKSSSHDPTPGSPSTASAASGPRTSLPAQVARVFYAIWSLSTFAVLMLVAAVLALVVPWLSWRRAITRACARAWLVLACLHVRATGLGRLPEGSCVLVANHGSYLDGIVMKAALPPRFGFVIKREAASMPVVGLLLRRIGAEFVDRHTRGGRHRDARRVVERAEQGHSLVFFPEGTFDATIGLKRFHVGAFVAAARGGAPVVPAVIHGARRALPTDTYVPRPGRIVIEVLPAIGGRGETPEQLRDAARAMIVDRLGEPDLAPRTTTTQAGVHATAQQVH